ncbi:hypothetical protein BD779DRAFT_1483164 [Infundibulicybe gibba]|nr:hypothetical protein BD779DRAFT_1483164 [Infundibulicybe gibba]
MHHCLLIPEILQVICAHLRGISRIQDWRRNLQAVALVCRNFHNATLDFLWYRIGGLLPLLRTLPSDVWSGPLTRHEAALARAITASDLERFRARARLVQSYYDSEYINVPIAIYQALSFHFHDQPIFPNLLFLESSRSEILPYLPMFLVPSICQVQLSISSDSIQNSPLPILGNRCPSLVHFELSTPDCYPNIGQQMKSILSQWGQLETLVIRYLPEESLQIVAALPHLCDFTLSHVDDDYGNTFSPTPGTDVFPALQRLTITASSPTLCVNLLKAATNCPLEDFTLFLFGLDPPVWRDLFATLAGLCGKGALTAIYIDDLVSQYDEQNPGTADELRLLFPLTGLTYLVLETCCGFDVDDAFMYEVAAAWPRIGTLSIGTTGTFQRFEPQRLTLHGLVPLAELCPNLQSLGVHVNVAHICSNHLYTRLGSNSKSRVRYLNVSRSPIPRKSVPWAAAYLSAIFPELREVEYNDDYGDSEQPAYPDRWSDIENHLAAYHYMSGHRKNDLHCFDCGLHV